MQLLRSDFDLSSTTVTRTYEEAVDSFAMAARKLSCDWIGWPPMAVPAARLRASQNWSLVNRMLSVAERLKLSGGTGAAGDVR